MDQPPAASSSQQNSLSLSLPLLRQSISSLSSALATLDACTADMPRLGHVLASTRHFELLPAPALAAAQDRIVDEIQPEVLRLLDVAQGVVERRERRGEWLRARWGLYEGRLGRDGGDSAAGQRASGAQARSEAAAATTQSTGDALRTQRLRQKKERLSYAVERLTLQAQQKERQLRMSMAAQAVKAEGSGSSEQQKTEEIIDDDDDFRV